jgi:GTP-binding protein
MEIVKALDWRDPWFLVSAIGHEGTREVCLKIQQFFDEQKYAASQEAAAHPEPSGGDAAARDAG